jgi:hypothetical protein
MTAIRSTGTNRALNFDLQLKIAVSQPISTQSVTNVSLFFRLRQAKKVHSPLLRLLESKMTKFADEVDYVGDSVTRFEICK